MGEAADHGPHRAYSRMTDQTGRFGHHLEAYGSSPCCEGAMGHHRPYIDPGGTRSDRSQTLDVCNIDDQRRTHQAGTQHRNQALTACEYPGIAVPACE